EERREYFREKLRQKLEEPEFRQIEGFPIGSDEDILALSDPPYYTACPNPFIQDFIDYYGRPYDPNEDYHREPFAADVSEGKNDPIYNAHSYHTKVPHKAIMRYILHYTKPGDIVYDGFCGTGMTGVAAQLCGDREVVESLGYRIDDDGTILKREINEQGEVSWVPFSKLGARYAVLNDLSPAATFIAYNYNTPVDVDQFEKEAKRILKEVEAECGWMYQTLHTDGKAKGRINYTVWSDVFTCPECAHEIIFWEAAVDQEAGKVRKEFPCPYCSAILKKSNMERAWTTKYDDTLEQTIRQAKQVPVLINYSIGRKRFEKAPDEADLALIRKIEESEIPYPYPTESIPDGDKTGEPRRIGITHAHHFYTKRNLWILAAFMHAIKTIPFHRLRKVLLFGFNSVQQSHSILNRFRFRVSFPSNVMSGTLYVASMVRENNIIDQLNNKYKLRLKPVYASIIRDNTQGKSVGTTSSASVCFLGNDSVDYVFTDPPFGSNLMYSELNFLWESWLKVYTDNVPEAIENRTQGKNLPQYQELMTRCFHEYYRVLKPGRWMTVEFHNSKNSVWHAIQEALQRAGLVVADVRTLDKKQGSFNQVVAGRAVKQDIIISAYKPNDGLEERFKLKAGTVDGAWDFVRSHLRQLPVAVIKDGKLEVITERMNYLLYDRMVAFHVERGVIVPISAGDFYEGLEQRFPQRDGMYFLPTQVNEYDRAWAKVEAVEQIEMFVHDEATAIQWLKQQLGSKPQTYQEIHPLYMKEISGWQRHEKTMELSRLLEENFLCYDGTGDVPSQICRYLSRNFKELRNVEKDDPALRAKAKERWYVPDANKVGDLEKLRERALLREFEEYRNSNQKRLGVFRSEAIRAGFRKAWGQQDYEVIVQVGSKIPERILQEDSRLIMWYDQASRKLRSR
ncbi:MAG: DNA methyltransferase, partial [Limnochordia bacterium]|nr:DNA methyltransferase [Limnochordia bacterium]